MRQILGRGHTGANLPIDHGTGPIGTRRVYPGGSSMTTRVRGTSRRISAAAARPSVFGIRMSSSATST
jgi:hypothetical protein